MKSRVRFSSRYLLLAPLAVAATTLPACHGGAHQTHPPATRPTDPASRYPIGTPRADLLARLGPPAATHLASDGPQPFRRPPGAGAPAAPPLPDDVARRARHVDEFLVNRPGLLGAYASPSSFFIDRVFYDADDRVLGTERYYAF